MAKDNSFFLDTMQGLLEAIAIEQGAIKMTEVSDMPAPTYRATSVVTEGFEPTESSNVLIGI